MPRALTAAVALAWCALATAIVVHGVRNLSDPDLWFDEAMQVNTSLGIDPMAAPFTPPGGLRAVVSSNQRDQLDPGGYGVLLHYWIRAFGTQAVALRLPSALLVVGGLGALAALARRWMAHPLAAPAAVALALIDPMVRQQALEVRAYPLELAATWIAFLAADRVLERPTRGRAIALGLVLVALIGSRYSAFLTAGAIAGALLPELVGLRGNAGVERRRRSIRERPLAIPLVIAPPLAAAAVIARWAIPGMIRRSTREGGRLVEYLAPYTARGLTLAQAAVAALSHLAHPATVFLTLAAALAVWPRRSTAPSNAHEPASRFVHRAALLVLVSTVLLWRWHPWNPAVKWSLYLHLVSTVCLLRIAAETLPRILDHRAGRRAIAATVLALVAAASALAAVERRSHRDVALPALQRIFANGLDRGEDAIPVAVDLHPVPALRYHYEFGSRRGRTEYPRAFVLPRGGRELTPAQICSARWLLSYDRVERLVERYPTVRFEPDPGISVLLRIASCDLPPPLSGRD